MITNTIRKVNGTNPFPIISGSVIDPRYPPRVKNKALEKDEISIAAQKLLFFLRTPAPRFHETKKAAIMINKYNVSRN